MKLFGRAEMRLPRRTENMKESVEKMEDDKKKQGNRHEKYVEEERKRRGRVVTGLKAGLMMLVAAVTVWRWGKSKGQNT